MTLTFQSIFLLGCFCVCVACFSYQLYLLGKHVRFAFKMILDEQRDLQKQVKSIQLNQISFTDRHESR
ncbi:MAG TPA: hypothetical protein DIT20_04800 [Sutterellaceae bacterium]|nr:hypothetical protein [Sutterellaceae bacterium]